MQITYLGHAGFCVEDERTIVITDPWLSPTGAFDSAWFPFPPNKHMAQFVVDKLSDSTRDRFVYISHEHQDHFDLQFLESLPNRDFTLIIPYFRHGDFFEKVAGYACARIARLEDRECIPLANGSIRIYLDDSVLNRDSALFVDMGGRTLFNMNDCKLFDRLEQVREDAGHVDVFACQFSGATWHPTCYQYDSERYAAISRRKAFAKFESVARAIETLTPKMYLPSAGPACFLDPELMRLNDEPVNTFPHAEKIELYLSRRLRKVSTTVPRIGPGAVVHVDGTAALRDAGTVVNEADRSAAVAQYAAGAGDLFARLQASGSGDVDRTLARLRRVFVEKYRHLSLAERVGVPLYFRFDEEPRRAVKVDFSTGSIEIVSEPCPESFYELQAPMWQVERVLDGALSWEEFSLTFRVKIRRNPDSYQPVLHAFLLLDGNDLAQWCAMIRSLEENRERIVVESGGRAYSVLRYCPHQGGDLLQGWVEGSCLVCPRHRWRFDLSQQGRCTTNDSSIEALPAAAPATVPAASVRPA